MPPDAAYDDIWARLNARRDEWPACGFCGAALSEQSDPSPSPDAIALAKRLAKYDRESARRTSVVDDQQDWYEVAASPFSTSEEAAEAWRKEEERREAAAKREFRIDIDVVRGRGEGGRRAKLRLESHHGVMRVVFAPRPACGDAGPCNKSGFTAKFFASHTAAQRQFAASAPQQQRAIEAGAKR